MEDGTDPSRPAGGPGQPSVTPHLAVLDEAERENLDRLAADEAFQTLANEVRVAVLVRLFAAERAGDPPQTFSALQEAVGSESSAGFAYHLRQLRSQFIRQTEEGYVLTPAGRRTAEAIVSGTFSDSSTQAS
jgi:hypothetical protein